MGEVAPLGDGEGRKNIKFYSFLRAIRESPLQLMGLVRILVERTYFVGVGAHDDQKKTINYCNTIGERNHRLPPRGGSRRRRVEEPAQLSISHSF